MFVMKTGNAFDLDVTRKLIDAVAGLVYDQNLASASYCLMVLLSRVLNQLIETLSDDEGIEDIEELIELLTIHIDVIEGLTESRVN